jgi:hypothetical protein
MPSAELFHCPRIAIRLLIPERDLSAWLYILGYAHDHHIADKRAARIAGTTMIDVRGVGSDTAGMMGYWLLGFTSKEISMFGEAGNFRAAEDVQGHDSFDEEPISINMISMRDVISDHLHARTYVSTIGFPSTASVLVGL